MSEKNINWTERQDPDAHTMLFTVKSLISRYGSQLLLEAFIKCIDDITAYYTEEDKNDYLILLRNNLEKTLTDYKNRYDE